MVARHLSMVDEDAFVVGAAQDVDVGEREVEQNGVLDDVDAVADDAAVVEHQVCVVGDKRGD